MIQQVLPLSKKPFSPYALKVCLQQRLAIALILLPALLPFSTPHLPLNMLKNVQFPLPYRRRIHLTRLYC